MIQVKFDDLLPPAAEASRVDEWERWFAATQDEESVRTWNAAKSVHTDPAVLCRWAEIIELNRLNRLFPGDGGK